MTGCAFACTYLVTSVLWASAQDKLGQDTDMLGLELEVLELVGQDRA